VQLARLAGAVLLITALGEDELGRSSLSRLRELGVEPTSVSRDAATRKAVTLIDAERERTIITFGERLQPGGSDAELPWSELARMDAVYFTAGDESALRAARAARILVASPRAYEALGHGIPIDALVLSEHDEIERLQAARAQDEAELVVFTEGERGGRFRTRAGESGSWTAAPPPSQPVDSYGCGDSFAAGLTYGLAAGMSVPAALAVAPRCGAVCLAGRGPYERQLTAADL
jgi:ribokinase